VGGGTGEQILRAPFLRSTTLDLPERARFSNPRGSLRHAGLGANWTRKTSDRWALQAGLLVNRLEARDYQLDFEILGGRNAGLRGTLDHSSTAAFATPYFGGQRSWNLTLGWSLRARASAGVPLPAGEFAGRIRSASFSGSSADAQGKPGRIGDGFVALGVAFLHRPSGLEFDLGGTAFFTVFEKTTHAGIDDALLLHVTWHWK
jgi:hypothetical protein